MKIRPLAITVLLAAFLITAVPALAVNYTYVDSWGDPGLHMGQESRSGVELLFSITSWDLSEAEINGEPMMTVNVPGMMLPNDAGSPDLPGLGSYIAVPNGAEASVRIVSSRTETISGHDLTPAFRIPLETETGPLEYIKDDEIYSRNAFYPENPVVLSEIRTIRGVATVLLGVTPFQYNPVTKELIVYRDLELEVTFEGGDGEFGEDRLRSTWWEPILADLLINYESIGDPAPPRSESRTPDLEYVILCQDDPDFVAWADSLKRFRSEQGLRAGVVTLSQIGGNTVSAIETYLNDAYTNWDIPPAAVLLLGDYGTGTTGITSPIYNSYCVSDNMFADVDGDHMPEMTLARITARNASELTTMIGKMLDYERHPPTNTGFYQNPLMAGGWQTERWFILCEEVLFGYLANVLGKAPVREYAIYSGTPGTVWSTATNTSTVVNYFGPNGLGYIPSTPAHLTDWSGSAAGVNTAVNRGAFILQHRDHGSTTGWGEPAYGISNLSGLSNEDLTFVFSINCLTGKYNLAGDCFAEVFHRHAQGALGLIAASETSYSFVNDAYVWGMYDFMWPDFDPGYGIAGPHTARPAFASSYGKYFLQASGWPYNTSNKEVTYHLFHHHGDAFMTLFTEMPENLTVSHNASMLGGADFFTVTADAGSWIGISAGGEFLGAAAGTGAPRIINITPQMPGTEILVAVTKQNCYRYEQAVPVVPADGPYLVYQSHVIDDAAGDGDGVLDEGEAAGFLITVENIGTQEATGVWAALSSADPYIDIPTDTIVYPNIPAGGSGTPDFPFDVEVDGEVPDQHVIQFTLTAAAADSMQESYFSVTAEAPDLYTSGLLVDDIFGGNGDGTVNAGEVVTFEVLLSNRGHSDASDLTATLSCADTNVTILHPAGDCPEVAVSGEEMLGTFMAVIAVTAPEPFNVDMYLDIGGSNGFATAIDFEMPVGGWFDDMEAWRGWIVGAADDDASAGIWDRLDPIGTEYLGHVIQMEDDHTGDPGSICYVTGNGSVGGTAGENDVDGGKTTLLTPVFDLSDAIGATISYWRWYSNSWGNSPDLDYWNVDVTSGGGTWVSLENTLTTEASWTNHTFTLTDYVELTGETQVRFVASDEGDGSLVEAGVDDFLLTTVRVVYTDVDEAEDAAPAKLVLGGNVPNPFNPSTTIRFDLPRPGKVHLDVYDISGRCVATLVSDELEAGRHEVTWSGIGRDGREVSSGLYFSRLRADGETRTRKMMLLK